MLVMDKKPMSIVADRFGVHRSTIWRWKKKWEKNNAHVSLSNSNKRKNAPTSSFRYVPANGIYPTNLLPHYILEDYQTNI